MKNDIKQQFNKDLQKIYNYIANKKSKNNLLYKYLEDKDFDKLKIIDQFAKNLNLTMDNDLRVALVSRLIGLRDDSLVQVFKKRGFSQKKIIILQEKTYQFVSAFWIKQHKQTIKFITTNKLLTPFYREIFKGVFDVGIYMTAWQSSWTAQIINKTNKDLSERFNNDNKKIISYLTKNNLLDLGHNKQIGDRCYSALVKKNGKYKSLPYSEAFKDEVSDVVKSLTKFENNLKKLDDNMYGLKEEYLLYIQSIIIALQENKTYTLIQRWADVDRAWMKITSPIQIGHPLEYYEDNLRKAVALEWDIRLSSPTLQNNNDRVKKIKIMFENIFDKLNNENNLTKKQKNIFDFSVKSLDKVQLYLGSSALFFGAEFNGLFSAQVVPNDEIVSFQMGKKIFAFSHEILQTQRAKPFLKLNRKIFGEKFLKKDRKNLFDDTNNSQKWHKVYDITTIGHEYGHILWCDESSESVMNKSGNFKNIEEFKATTGGLVSFFMDKTNQELDSLDQVIDDIIKRAIGLIGWMEVDEVLPYYCEGLIHLDGLFKTKTLIWDNKKRKLTINTDKKTIKKLQKWYINAYKSLALHYLLKKDATLWLDKYITKKDRYFLPNDKNIKSFVKYYFNLYKAIGQELDTKDKKSNYIFNT